MELIVAMQNFLLYMVSSSIYQISHWSWKTKRPYRLLQKFRKAHSSKSLALLMIIAIREKAWRKISNTFRKFYVAILYIVSE